MKIKTKHISWAELEKLPKLGKIKPLKPLFLLQALIYVLSLPEIWAVRLRLRKVGMEKAGKGPYFILMNHSGFLDLKIANHILFPHPYAIVSTTDAFVGKKLLMRLIGCMPTQKFVTDVSLVMEMIRTVKKRNLSILMYPEAGYSFDGTCTTLPRRLGGMVKRLGIPLVMIRTDAGCFLRNPLYNELKLRKVKGSVELKLLLTPEEIKEKSQDEIDAIIDEAFSFDHFAAQLEEKIPITEPFRAAGLHRVLYRCPHCEKDGVMVGEGVHLRCKACGADYELDEYGALHNLTGETRFSHIPRWYAWEREAVREEIEKGEYALNLPVKVGVITDYKAMYLVGEGTLSHDESGFVLTSSDGTFTYRQDARSSYGLNADFFFYEMGDVIGIGNKDRLCFCYPAEDFPVAKARLATEELYRLQSESVPIAAKV